MKVNDGGILSLLFTQRERDAQHGAVERAIVRATRCARKGAHTLSKDDEACMRRAINICFIRAICAPRHARGERRKLLLSLSRLVDRSLYDIMRIYARETRAIRGEARCVSRRARGLAGAHAAGEQEASGIDDNELGAPTDTLSRLYNAYRLFFPEGAPLLNRETFTDQIAALRDRRTVRITSLNENAISDPSAEILFTANVLLTTPREPVDTLRYPPALRETLRNVAREHQQYWYDHPIAAGCGIEEHELLYGLQGLEEMADFEKRRGSMREEQKISVLLSISSTHNGLHRCARSLLTEDIRAHPRFKHLSVWGLTEDDCQRIYTTILLPVARIIGASRRSIRDLEALFGVDGEYGRHYTLLKAISALWSVLVDTHVRATFKIDLDQRFPEEHLVSECGKSALELFTTPLWGATAVDYYGRAVHLGMLAGALVNEKDIDAGLFTPDVVYDFQNRADATGGKAIFDSRLPQALSTVAEMGYQHPQSNRDEDVHIRADRALQRIHVTGGTNGILVSALRRYRPFTPITCGRAEDQAYLLSVLDSPAPPLRYAHCPGLIMRHDKHGFAQQAIADAATATRIGDYTRMLFFSGYASCLRGGIHTIKRETDPFTGAFISPIPRTVSYMRWALECEHRFSTRSGDAAVALQMNGIRRLPAARRQYARRQFRRDIVRHRRAWNLYYDIVDYCECELRNGSQYIEGLRDAMRDIISDIALSI